MINWSQFQDYCRRELILCGVTEGQTLAVLSQGNDRLDYADAFITAARGLGAEAYNIRLGNTASVLNGPAVAEVGINPLAGNRGAVNALKEADIVIDLVFMLWSDEQHEIQAAGTRILTVIEDQGVLIDLFPTEDHRRRCEVSAELLDAAHYLRVTSPGGTDVTYKLQTYNTIAEYGFTDQPGRWDMWPGGFAFTAGAADGVDGKVVIDRGDIIAAPFRSYVAEPIHLTLEKGMIVDIRGGHDAELMKDYIAKYDDPRGYAASHIGWGLNEKARWSSMAGTLRSMGQEARAYYGNVMFATGPNTELGGDNDTPAHMDIPLRNCSVFLDDAPVMIDGDFTVDELRHRRG